MKAIVVAQMDTLIVLQPTLRVRTGGKNTRPRFGGIARESFGHCPSYDHLNASGLDGVSVRHVFLETERKSFPVRFPAEAEK